MPESFTKECEDARVFAQNAVDDFHSALDVTREARSRLRTADRKLQEANDRLDKAKEQEQNAIKAWDELIATLRAKPNFDMQGVEAGFQLPAANIPPDARIVGPIPVRNAPTHILWGSCSTDEDKAKWSKISEQAMLNAQSLKSDTDAAKKEVEQLEKEVSDAQTAKDNAQADFDAAEKVSDQAEEKVAEARKGVSSTQGPCDGQTKTITIEGVEVEVDPGVLPNEEKRVIDALKSIDKKELQGLKKVKLKDEVGHEFTYTDKNTGEEVKTKAAATYSSATQTITGKSGDYDNKTTLHEVGHHVYSKRLEDDRKKWDAFWNKDTNNLKSPAGKMPTGYSSENEAEGFSESYKQYKTGGQLDPEVKTLMDDLLGGIK